MKLIIVRHGETIENVNGTIQGQKYGTLSESGIEQAKRLALRLRDERIDAIFSSDLQRARDTALEIAKFHDIPINYTAELRERGFGIFEGKHRDEYYRFADESHLPRTEQKPEGGESFAELKERSRQFLDSLYVKYRGKTVLLVTHGGCIKMMLGILLRMPIEEAAGIEQKNTSVNIIEVKDNSEHKAHVINCIKHL